MKLSVVGFTHTGTVRNQNQDRVLVHDQLVFSEKFAIELNQPAHFFVADGVGGAPAGDFAANFVLDRIKDILSSGFYNDIDRLFNLLHTVNHELLNFSESNPEYEGMATTLAGIVFWNNSFRTISAGDSQVFLLRNSTLTKLTTEPVFGEAGGNNPISSYFGGNIQSLNLVISPRLDSQCKNDVFLVSTDGIFKVLTVGQIEKILSNSKTLKEKSDFIFYKTLQTGSPDNISCIFIEIN